MASWIAGTDPFMAMYDPAAGAPWPVLGAQSRAFFASPGSVDSQIPTRMQVPIPQQAQTNPAFNDPSRIVILGEVNYDSGDWATRSARGGYLSCGLFVAPQSAFPSNVTPTPSQVLALGSSLMVYRSYFLYNGTSSDGTVPPYPLAIQGPFPSDLTANTKYWLLIIPTSVQNRNSAPSYANDIPLHTSTGASDPDTLGRAISIWTNRTPGAPTIVSPANGANANPESTLSLSISSGDPDAMFGGSTSYYTDIAGVQIQYSAVPTADNPTPTWLDLGFANADASATGPGWAITKSTVIPPDAGAWTLLGSSPAVIRCGSNTLHANEGVLPSGNWRLRARTFDFGHDFPAIYAPLNTTGGNLAPSVYPSTNTSPWSDPVTVTVPARVPPAIPMGPRDGAAEMEGFPVVLSWQYRNSATPPSPQAGRLVQIRKAGEDAWTTLVDDTSSASSFTIDPGGSYPLAATTAYEWRVQTKDSLETGNFSSIASFWVVPAPSSGSVRPDPSSTIDAATLGCGVHRGFIYRRGGVDRVGEIRGFSHLDWSRVRDDISTAQVVVQDWDIDCGNLLAELQTWAYELVIFRDNGFTVDRVWEGPITLLTWETDKVTIDAKDVMVYAYRRIIKQEMNDAAHGANTGGNTVTSRAAQILQNVLAPDDPNVLAYISLLSRSDDAVEYRSIPAYSRTAYEEIDDMAANAGLDYTVIGRSIMLWGTKHRIGLLPEFRDENFGSPPIVSEYGMSMANVYSVSDGQGTHGEANRLGVSGNDPIYGLVEMLSSSWASDSADDSGTYTQDGLAKKVASFEEFAERSISDRYPPPVVVRVPDNTTLNPDTVISIQQLVPGVAIPLRSSGTLRKVAATQKLDSIKVVEENGVESISVTLSPFSGDDSGMGSGGDEDA